MKNTIHNSLPMNYSIDSTFNSDKFIKLRFDFAHDGINRKKTRFSKELLEDKKGGLFLSPVLGHIIQNEDGTYKFGRHDIEFRPNPYQDNQIQKYYIETILGIIPPEEYADFEIKQVKGQNRVFVTGYLYKKYSNFAEDILREYENNPVSMETDILKYTYSAEEDVYDVLDFEYNGITFLGQDVTPGMVDANVQLYAVDEDTKKQMVIMLQELKSLFSLNADDKKIEKGGLIMNDNQEVKKTEEAQPAPVEDSTVVEENTAEAVTTTPETDNTEVGIMPEEIEPTVESEARSEDMAENFEQGTTVENSTAPKSADFIKTFSISHEDIRSGLYNKLLSVEEADQTCYYIESVYDDHFEYSSYDTQKYYVQKYSVGSDGTIEFSEARTQLYIEKLTAEEKTILDTMRQNYDAQVAELNSLKEFKEKYDLAEKEAIMNKWSAKIGSLPEFTELMNNNNYAAFSKDDIETKCKCIFADNTAFTCNFADTSKSKEFSPISVSLNDNTEAEAQNLKPYNGFIEQFASR